MNFKGVGFDYGGVIAGPVGGEFNKAISRVLDMPEEEYRAAYRTRNDLANNGEIGWDVFWENLLKEMGKTEKLGVVRKFLSEWPTHEINQNVLDLAAKLKEAGYKVGMLSNNTVENLARMKQVKLDDYFDPLVISAEIRFSKPGRKAFEIFLERMGTSPQETIFIDDAERNIAAANEIGCTGILFIDYDSLVKDLSRLGVKL